MKALYNRFYVKFMQLEIGLLKCPFASSKMSILYAFLAYRPSSILCNLIAYFIMLICLQSRRGCRPNST